MIEMFASVFLILIYFIGKFLPFFDFNELFIISYKVLLLFIVFGRCFLTIAQNKLLSEKKRFIIETVLFSICTTCLIILYLNNFCVFQFYIVPKAVIYTICISIFFIIKFYTLKNNIYGKVFFICQIADIFFVSFAGLNTLFVSESYFSIIIINMLIIGLVNEYSLFKQNYWLALKDFTSNIEYLIITNDIMKITYPPIKNLESDIIFSKCVILLKYSNLRMAETYKLAKIVKKLLSKYGINKTKAHEISSQFLGILNNNLMRRENDTFLFPTRFLNILQEFQRR